MSIPRVSSLSHPCRIRAMSTPNVAPFFSIRLDKDSPNPIYLQIAEGIGELLKSGALPAGYVLPPERALCERFGISRMTLRQAMGLLDREGLIESRRGRATRAQELQRGNSRSRGTSRVAAHLSRTDASGGVGTGFLRTRRSTESIRDPPPAFEGRGTAGTRICSHSGAFVPRAGEVRYREKLLVPDPRGIVRIAAGELYRGDFRGSSDGETQEAAGSPQKRRRARRQSKNLCRRWPGRRTHAIDVSR